MYVTSLHSHAIQVPDLSTGADFYTDFGLEVSDDAGLGSVRCNGASREQLVLREGPDKRLQSVTFCVRPGSLGELRTRLADAGHGEVDGLGGRGDGLWVRDPDGLLLQLIEEDGGGSSRTYPEVSYNFGEHADRVDDPRWLAVAAPRPRRLGHVIKFTADLAAVEHFYLEVLELKLSDRMPFLSFWNTGAGGDHHVFGAIQSSHPALHHSSWEVADFDEMGMGAQNMAQKGHTLQWGLGRHTFGSNLFNYIRDPWGSWVEYFSDMDKITPCWQGKTWEVPPMVWGPPPPEEFLANIEAVPAGG